MKEKKQIYLPDRIKEPELIKLNRINKKNCWYMVMAPGLFLRQISIMLIVLLLVLLTGCGQPAAGGGMASPGAERVEGAAVSQPYTVTDDAGRKIRLKGKPRRIVSVTYGTDEILKVLTEPGRILAYSRYAGDPEISFLSKADAAAVGKQVQENTEAIFALQPDLVIISGATPPDMLYAMEQMGLTVYVAVNPKNYDQMKQKVWHLGLAIGEEAKAKELLKKMDSRMRRLEQRLAVIPDKQRKTAVAFTMSGPMGRKGDLFDSILQAAHVVNGAAIITPMGVRGQISKEQVVEVDPDIFILPTWNYDKHQDTQKFIRELAEDPAFRNVKAIRNGKLLPVSDRYRYVASHHIVDAIENIAYAVYPEVFPEGKPPDQE